MPDAWIVHSSGFQVLLRHHETDCRLIEVQAKTLDEMREFLGEIVFAELTEIKPPKKNGMGCPNHKANVPRQKIEGRLLWMIRDMYVNSLQEVKLDFGDLSIPDDFKRQPPTDPL